MNIPTTLAATITTLAATITEAIRKAVEEEREACARLVTEQAAAHPRYVADMLRAVCDAIRARGKAESTFYEDFRVREAAEYKVEIDRLKAAIESLKGEIESLKANQGRITR